jgi:hypothetical protein
MHCCKINHTTDVMLCRQLVCDLRFLRLWKFGLWSSGVWRRIVLWLPTFRETCCLLTEDGGNRFLRNIGNYLQDCMTSESRTPQSKLVFRILLNVSQIDICIKWKLEIPMQTRCLLKTNCHVNISFAIRLGLPSDLFPSGFQSKILCAVLTIMRTTCPTHLSRPLWFYHLNNILLNWRYTLIRRPPNYVFPHYVLP